MAHVKKEEAGAHDGQYVLFPADFEKVRKKVARLNRKAAKKGGAQAELEIVRQVTLPVYNGDQGEVALVYVVEARGELFRVQDYSLVATLEHSPIGNIIRTAPDSRDFDATAYRHVEGYCEHCKTKRARKDTFVLRGPSGNLMQVGRNCLADFLRESDVATFFSGGDILCLLEETSQEVALPGGFFTGYDVDTFLATAHRIVKLDGFRTSASDFPTKLDVIFALGRCPTGECTGEWERLQPKDADFEAVDAIKAFVEGMGDTDYAHNLKVAIGRGYVDYRSAGLVTSAVGVFLKDEAKKREAKAKLNEHFGEVKQRYEVELEVSKIIGYSSVYGDGEILIMHDSEGRTYKWKTKVTAFEQGDRLVGKATVKGHEEYKGRKQTDLSRCTFEVVSGPTIWGHILE